jgi:hypothetical protein
LQGNGLLARGRQECPPYEDSTKLFTCSALRLFRYHQTSTHIILSLFVRRRSLMSASPEKRTETPENVSTQACEPASGPVREKGGTTGVNNLSPGGADRTGGASAGVTDGDPIHERAKKLTPDP